MVFSSLPIFLDPPNWGQVIDLPYRFLSLNTIYTFSFIMYIFVHKHKMNWCIFLLNIWLPFLFFESELIGWFCSINLILLLVDPIFFTACL
jgi:hypothetical protein